MPMGLHGGGFERTCWQTTLDSCGGRTPRPHGQLHQLGAKRYYTVRHKLCCVGNAPPGALAFYAAICHDCECMGKAAVRGGVCTLTSLMVSR
jgi:hypothetical protein